MSIKEVIDRIDKIDNDTIQRILDKFPYDEQLIILRERCKVGDKAACKVYDITVNGNKDAPAGTPEWLGLKGRWLEKKDARARQILEKIGEL